MTFARRTHDLNTGNSLTEEKIENEFDAIYNVFNGTTDVEVELKGGLTIEAQSGFSAYRATAQSIATATGSVLIFNTEVYDNLGEYNNTTGIFTATVAGTYQCNWAVGLTTATYAIGEFMYTHILKNNLTTAGNSYYGQVTRCEAAVTQGISSVGSCIFQLAIGDTLRVLAVHNQGAAVNCSASGKYNYFMVQKIA